MISHKNKLTQLWKEDRNILSDRIIRNQDCDLSRYKFGKLEKEYENINRDAHLQKLA